MPTPRHRGQQRGRDGQRCMKRLVVDTWMWLSYCWKKVLTSRQVYERMDSVAWIGS